tara:strand:+ start:2119 stop:2403 length:285 start_codon:yes stop_codon:yes gene_type:complete
MTEAKASRENMHDTSHAMTSIDAESKYQAYKKLVLAFEDILSSSCEPYDVLEQHRLTGEDIHNALQEAIELQKDWHRQELNILDDLLILSNTGE